MKLRSRFLPSGWTFTSALVVLAVGGALTVWAPPTEAQGLVAKIEGKPVTLEELETSLTGELRQLERQRHQLLEGGLDALIQTRLLELEANARKLTKEQLLAAEVDAKKTPISDAEVDAWYVQNQSRINRPKEGVVGQIRTFLEQQQAQGLQAKLLADLATRYKVERLLEPLRVEVASAQAPARGPASAPVTIVEFSDFQCPWCSKIGPALEQLLTEYAGKVRLEFRHFPIDSIHPEAQGAAEATMCANEQGKFWQLHDDLFANQRELAVAKIKERAAGLGLDVAKLGECLDASRHRDFVKADQAAGLAAGVNSTPSIFVNGRAVNLSGAPTPFDALKLVVEDELARKARS